MPKVRLLIAIDVEVTAEQVAEQDEGGNHAWVYAMDSLAVKLGEDASYKLLGALDPGDNMPIMEDAEIQNF